MQLQIRMIAMNGAKPRVTFQNKVLFSGLSETEDKEGKLKAHYNGDKEEGKQNWASRVCFPSL